MKNSPHVGRFCTAAHFEVAQCPDAPHLGEESLHDRRVGEVLGVADRAVAFDEKIRIRERRAERLLDHHPGARRDRVQRVSRVTLRRAAHHDDVRAGGQILVPAGDRAGAGGQLLRLLAMP